jgi:polyisoprenoid-binding protein YceI
MSRAWLLLALGLLIEAVDPAWAEPWAIDRSASRLAFVATWEGSGFEGIFRRFEADIRFDPHRLAASGFDVTVDVTSADTNSADRDAALADPEWFFSERYPRATFVTSAIRSMGNGRYEADATLTIKGVSRSVVLPFTWRESGGRAEMDGEAVLHRTDFNIGEGEWAEGDVIGLDVRVRVDLALTQLPANDMPGR